MDLNSIEAIATPDRRDALPQFGEGDAWLAGGTWLFSEPQPHLKRLIDLTSFDWPPVERTEAGLAIAATCTVANLESFEAPVHWLAGALISQCCRAFLASFKIWNVATVGGNLCLALPAGPMISLCVALEGRCIVWKPDGNERELAAVDLILGPQKTSLAPGEILRRVDLPTSALSKRSAMRRISLTELGRSGALLIGTLADDGQFVLTVTASTRRPIQMVFESMPGAAGLQGRIADEIPFAHYYDDIHGRPDWRQHVTREFAEEIRDELSGWSK